MKKLIALIITIVMCLSVIIACDNNDDNKTADNASDKVVSVISSDTSAAPSSVDPAISSAHSTDRSEDNSYSSTSSNGSDGSASYDSSDDSSADPSGSVVQPASDSHQSASEGSQSGSDSGQGSSGSEQGGDSQPAFKTETLEFNSELTGEQAIKAFAIEKFEALFAAARDVSSVNANKLFGAAYSTVEFKLYSISGEDEAIKSNLSKIYSSAYKLYAAFYKADDTLESIKEQATTIVDSLYDIAANGVSEDKIALIKQSADSVKNSIKGSTDVESVAAIEKNEISNAFVEKIISYVNNAISEKLAEIKSIAKERLDQEVSDALDLLQDDLLAARLNEFYRNESAKLMAIESLNQIDSTIDEVRIDLLAFINSLKDEKIAAIKLEIKTELDSKINALTAKISDEELRGQINAYYENEIAVIANIKTVEEAGAAVSVIKTDTEAFAKEVIASQLAKLKTNALSELDTVVSTALGKLKTQSLKDSLNEFYGQEKEKLEAINSLDSAPAALAGIKSDVINYAKKLVASQTAELRKACKNYLVALRSALEYSPYDFVPRTMRPDYSANIVNVNDVTYDFTSFVAVNSINYGGFGEQWHMVVDNIDQSALFYKYLNYGDAVVTTAVSALSAYLDDEYSETVEYTIDAEKYYASIGFPDGVFSVELVYKAGLNIPVIGSVNPSIEMSYDVASATSEVYIALGEDKSIRYEKGRNYYRFGLELAMSAYTRTSYISFERKDSTVEGHIYEYHTVKGKDAVKSCADFYITDQYVSVVGNKASGLFGLNGYISELYDVRYGKLIGYEIEESKSFPVIGERAYNTLWFNLSDISGIANVKAIEKDSHKENENPHMIYINGNESAIFAATYNKKLGFKTSRKYDIELRKRYFYSTDAEGKLVEIEVEIPMMFIQEDNDEDSNFSDYPTDVSAANGITSEVTLSGTYLNKILADYDELIPMNNEDTIDSNYIKAYIEG